MPAGIRDIWVKRVLYHLNRFLYLVFLSLELIKVFLGRNNVSFDIVKVRKLVVEPAPIERGREQWE